jgi:hypothetical protein
MKNHKSVLSFEERVRVNQRELRSNLKSHCDFIVCGSGSSGLVVARRHLALEMGRIRLGQQTRRKHFRTGSFVPFTIILEWSRCLFRNMRIPFITRLSVIKADPKTEASFDQEQTARCKTFIWSPFVGGLSAFAVILPRPFSC